MNWFRMINDTTTYIEDHITEDIDLKFLSERLNVSYHYFVKTFSMVTGYTLKEYIRNRRITLASYDVSNTSDKILDIALRYGYSSNESFSRAFKKIHGINPLEARRNHVTIYTHFPVLIYDVPDVSMISLRYDFVKDLYYEFIGKSIYIIEEDYLETQELQKQFVKDFTNEFPNTSVLYKVHHNLSFDNLRYDYLVGYKADEVENASLQKLVVKSEKAVRFISSNITLDMIPRIKSIIYDEWYKNDFQANSVCEIEYVLPVKENLFDFYYIVSIN